MTYLQFDSISDKGSIVNKLYRPGASIGVCNTMLKYNELNAGLLYKWFPELQSIIDKENELSEGLPHCLFADVINPVINNLLKNEDDSDKILIDRIFAFFEYLASNGDEKVCNLLEVSLLENLWGDKTIYCRSLGLMKENTLKINNNISRFLKNPT